MAESGMKRDVKEGAVAVRVNPKIYPLPIVQQAADVFIDRAYVFLDGDPEKEIRVILKPKDRKADLEKLCGEFNNELVDYSAYFVRSQISRDVREALVKRAFLTVTGEEGAVDLESQNRRIDFGTKVPLVGDSAGESSNKKKEVKPVKSRKTTYVENLEIKKAEQIRSGKRFPEIKEVERGKKGRSALSDILAPWDKQKGAIKKDPKDLC